MQMPAPARRRPGAAAADRERTAGRRSCSRGARQQHGQVHPCRRGGLRERVAGEADRDRELARRRSRSRGATPSGTACVRLPDALDTARADPSSETPIASAPLAAACAVAPPASPTSSDSAPAALADACASPASALARLSAALADACAAASPAIATTAVVDGLAVSPSGRKYLPRL